MASRLLRDYSSPNFLFMEKRKLGTSDLKVSVIGFGAWGIGGHPFWTNEGDNESVRAVEKAFDSGINFFDTAPVYGFGRSERLIAKALNKKRDKVILATKCGLRWEKEAAGSIRKDSTAKSIRFEIEESLKRLKTDFIDLYQVHWPDPDTSFRETMEELLKLKEEKKILTIGLSNFSKSQMEECLKYGEFVSLQSMYNMLERDLEKDEIPFCKEKGIGIIPYSPLASGVLTGKYDKQTKFKDWRGKGLFGNFSGEIFESHIDKVEKLKSIASSYGKKVSHLAINWLLAQEGVSTAIVGAKKAVQVQDNQQATGWEISREDMTKINELLAM